MTSETVVRSTCELCNSGCGVLVYLRDGKAVRVEGDPDNPVNKGALCVKGMASLDYLYHPDRLKHPLKRVGERGKGKWQQITWDEALNIVAAELTKTKEKYGLSRWSLFAGRLRVIRIAIWLGLPMFLVRQM